MRRIFTLFIFSLLSLLVGCNDPHTSDQGEPQHIFFALDKESLTISPDGGSADVTIYCNYNWKIYGTSDWCTPSVKEGVASRDGFVVSFTADVAYDPREATFWFHCGDKQIKFSVTQDFKPAILPNEYNTFNIPSEGGFAVIKCQTTVVCEVVIPEEAQSWISITPSTRALSEYSVSLNIAKNQTISERSAVVKVVAIDNEDISEEYTITQSGRATDLPIYYDDFDGKEATQIETDGNSRWPLLEEFTEFANTSGDGIENVTYSGAGITICANTTSNGENSQHKGSGINSLMFSGDKYGDAHFIINNINLNDPNHRHYKITFGIKSDKPTKSDDFKLFLSNNGHEWCEVEYEISDAVLGEWNIATANFTFDTVHTTLYIKFEALALSQYYIDDIALYFGNGGQSVNLEDIFTADPFIELSVYHLGYDYIENSKCIEITSNSKWEVKISADWVAVTPRYGKNNGTITVYVAENTIGVARSTEVKVSVLHPEYGTWDTKKLTISQTKAPAEKVTIAEVLALGNGATINGAIEGIVVSNYELNNLTSKKGMYVQDETGALQFYLGGDHTFAFGTKVQIDLTGAKLGEYNGAVQVSGLALDKITAISTGNTVTPKVVTMDDFLANKYEGQYISIEGVQVVEADLTKTWSTTDSHTSIYMQNAEGKQFVVFSSKYATYGAETVAQGAGTISGISSISKGVMQIIFAQASDYAGLTGERFTEPETPENPEQPTPGEIMTIAEALAVGNGNTIGGIIEGVVVSNMDLNNLASKKYMYVQDETGALQFYLGGNHTFAFGTKVQIDLTGAKLGEYNGAVQVSGLALDKITAISTGNTVTPKVVTMDDFLANKYEGQYISIEGVQVVADDLAKTWSTTDSHTSIYMQNAEGKQFVVFSSKYATYGAETVAQGAGTISGISSISKGVMRIIFAQTSDYAGLTGERFTEPKTPETPSIVIATIQEFYSW